MTPLTPETMLSRSPELVAAEMDGDVVMLSIERGQYFGLSAVGRRVWELIETPASVREICRAICAEFAVEEDPCLKDLLAFAADLVQNGIAKTS